MTKFLNLGILKNVDYSFNRRPSSVWRSLDAISLYCKMEGPDVCKALFSCNAKMSSIVPDGGDRLTNMLLLAMDKQICDTLNSTFMQHQGTEKIKLPQEVS